MSRVLVTGANGHLGQRLLRRLMPAVPVTAVVRSASARRLLDALALPGDLRVDVVDYRDEDALGRSLDDCSHVVHLVGIIKEGPRNSYRAAHEDVTAALARAASTSAVERIVCLSIVGAAPDSTNACLRSRAHAERNLLDARTPALILRVPMVLGEGDFAARALAAKARARLVFLLRGASREQPIYAGNVVEAMVAGLEAEGLGGRILELAGPESLSRCDLVRRAAAPSGHRPWIVSLPLALGMAAAALLERLPNPPVTRSMLGVLDHDDEVDVGGALTALGIELTPLDETLSRTI